MPRVVELAQPILEMQIRIMKLYKAKVYVSLKYRYSPNRYPIEVWEEIVLFLASSLQQAKVKAVQWGLDDTEGTLEDFSFLHDGSPMMQKCEGIRELTELPFCSSSQEMSERVHNGIVISHSFFVFKTQEEVKAFLTSTCSELFKYLGAASRSDLHLDFGNGSPKLLGSGISDGAHHSSRMWRGAHVIYQVNTSSESYLSGQVLLLDLLVLVGPATERESLQLAESLGKEYSTLISIEVGGSPAQIQYLGIRQIVLVDNEAIGEDFSDLEPTDNTEVSFNKFLIDNSDSLIKLIKDEDAFIRCAPT